MSKLKIKSLCLIVFKSCAITQLRPSLTGVYEAKIRHLREKTYNRRIQQNSVTIQLNIRASNFTFRFTGHARKDAKALPCTRILLHYNLGQNRWEICNPPPPQIKDGKMARFGFCAASSLLWGGWGFAVPFYSVQDCLRASTSVTHSVMYRNHDNKSAQTFQSSMLSEQTWSFISELIQNRRTVLI